MLKCGIYLKLNQRFMIIQITCLLEFDVQMKPKRFLNFTIDHNFVSLIVRLGLLNAHYRCHLILYRIRMKVYNSDSCDICDSVWLDLGVIAGFSPEY